MKSNYLFYILIAIGLMLLFVDVFSDSVYAKMIGIVIIMFSVYKLQANIPSKTEREDGNNTKLSDDE